MWVSAYTSSSRPTSREPIREPFLLLFKKGGHVPSGVEAGESLHSSLGCLCGMYSLEEANSFSQYPGVENTRLMHRQSWFPFWGHFSTTS